MALTDVVNSKGQPYDYLPNYMKNNEKIALEALKGKVDNWNKMSEDVKKKTISRKWQLKFNL